MKKIWLFVLWFSFFGISFASEGDSSKVAVKPYRYLKLSTLPSGADTYVNTSHPDFASAPDYKSPDFIKVENGESDVLVTLFSPEYADTTINVKLSDKDTSYLIVSLRPNYNQQQTEEQQKILAHRARRSLGHKLLVASIVPIAAGGISAIVTNYEIRKARDDKNTIEKSRLQDGSVFQDSSKDFDRHKDNAKKAKNLTKAGLLTGGVILATGIILSF